MTSSPSLILIPSPEITAEVNACIGHLAGLESVWQGAQRSRLILEELWKYTRSKGGRRPEHNVLSDLLSHNRMKRSFSQLDHTTMEGDGQGYNEAVRWTGEGIDNYMLGQESFADFF
jgi:hypothetical protein